MAPRETSRTTFYTMSDLAARGWSRSQIDAILYDSPLFPKGIFRAGEIEFAEQTDIFKKMQRENRLRGASNQRNIQITERATALAEATLFLVDTPKTWGELAYEAIREFEDHTQRPYMRETGHGFEDPRERLMRNHLRHRCSTYDRVLRDLSIQYGNSFGSLYESVVRPLANSLVNDYMKSLKRGVTRNEQQRREEMAADRKRTQESSVTSNRLKEIAGVSSFEKFDFRALAGKHLMVEFIEESLVGADFSGLDLRGSAFYGCDLTDSSFQYAEMHRVQIEGCTARRAQFSGVDISEGVMLESDFSDALLVGSNLHRAAVWSTDFQDADFYLASHESAVWNDPEPWQSSATAA